MKTWLFLHSIPITTVNDCNRCFQLKLKALMDQDIESNVGQLWEEVYVSIFLYIVL